MGNKDKEWNIIFKKLDLLKQIDSKGYVDITSRDFLNVGRASNIKMEARLFTKHDTSNTLPKVMVDNELSILSISRYSWRIGRFETFKKADNSFQSYEIIPFVNGFQTFSIDSIKNETSQLNYAHITGILDNFVGERIHETLSGKASSGTFDFNIALKGGETTKFSVKNAQIEIDKVYEGANRIYVVEAKQFGFPDFTIRQLFYPYKMISSLPGVTKPVVPIHVVYQKGLYMLEEYSFNDPNYYNSIELSKQTAIKLIGNYNQTDLKLILTNAKVKKEPSCLFPQANNVILLMNVLGYLRKYKTAKDIASYIAYDNRQGQYYGDALVYLNFAKKKNNSYMANVKIQDFEKEFAEALAQLPIFRDILQQSLNNGVFPKKDYIAGVIRNNRKDISNSTLERRCSTVKSWCLYVLKAFNVNVII